MKENKYGWTAFARVRFTFLIAAPKLHGTKRKKEGAEPMNAQSFLFFLRRRLKLACPHFHCKKRMHVHCTQHRVTVTAPNTESWWRFKSHQQSNREAVKGWIAKKSMTASVHTRKSLCTQVYSHEFPAREMAWCEWFFFAATHIFTLQWFRFLRKLSVQTGNK